MDKYGDGIICFFFVFCLQQRQNNRLSVILKRLLNLFYPLYSLNNGGSPIDSNASAEHFFELLLE